MSYIAELKDGRKITIDGAVLQKKDGAGTRFYDKDGGEVASFYDGIVVMAYSAAAKIEDAPAPASVVQPEQPK